MEEPASTNTRMAIVVRHVLARVVLECVRAMRVRGMRPLGTRVRVVRC